MRKATCEEALEMAKAIAERAHGDAGNWDERDMDLDVQATDEDEAHNVVIALVQPFSVVAMHFRAFASHDGEFIWLQQVELHVAVEEDSNTERATIEAFAKAVAAHAAADAADKLMSAFPSH